MPDIILVKDHMRTIPPKFAAIGSVVSDKKFSIEFPIDFNVELSSAVVVDGWDVEQ